MTMLKTSFQKLMNIKTKEIWLCENLKQIKLIDGVEFVTVQRDPTGRTFFMRKDQFDKVK